MQMISKKRSLVDLHNEIIIQNINQSDPIIRSNQDTPMLFSSQYIRCEVNSIWH